MKVTVCFDNVRVVVPCGDGTLLVRDLMHESILRYRKATGKLDSPTINSLSSLTGGGLLDPDDRLCDVADDREQIVAHLNNDHAGGDGASSVGTNSPDFFQETKERRYDARSRTSGGNIKRESIKRLSMHALSTREPHLTAYSALSLPRETRRREPLGQDSKICQEFLRSDSETPEGEVKEIIVKNEAGPLGLHVVPCYDISGNDQGLRVEGIEANGRIAKDGQIDVHDRIIKINGHSLLRIPFSKVQSILASCMSEPCLRISVLKQARNSRKSFKGDRNGNTQEEGERKSRVLEKSDHEEGIRKVQSYNILQSSNTRKIGRMIDIDLTKGSNGLGFSVTTRDNPAGGHCPIYIKNILPKGAAVDDGRLRPGDRLLQVNSIEMTGKSQSEVVSLLRSIPSGGKVRMLVSRQEEIGSSENNQPAVSDLSETTPDISRSWNPESSSLSLRKSKEALQGAEKRIEDCSGNFGLEARWEKPQSCGSSDKCWEKALPCKMNEASEPSPRKNRIILTLDIPVHDSEKAGLGVSVKGKTSHADENTNMDLGIFIKSVLNGGAASRDGRLRTNDQLLNVNGVSLLGLSNSDAMETLRRAMLTTNSSITGVITLTVARRVNSNYGSEKSYLEALNSCKLDPVNGNHQEEVRKFPESRVREKNSLNSQGDTLKVTSSPWNPVIDRLTEQYNKNSLRNESYCLATNKTWLNSVSNVKKLMLGNDGPEVTLEEDGNRKETEWNRKDVDRNRKELDWNRMNVEWNRKDVDWSRTDAESNRKESDVNLKDGKKVQGERNSNLDDRESLYSGDLTYDSQLSLEEINSGGNQFSRDALGRQSMSEKRHAALDAKNTDTYKRNKKLRDERAEKNLEGAVSRESADDSGEKRGGKIDNLKNGVTSGISGENASYEDRRVDRKVEDQKYPYGISGNKFASPRKHWLVDDESTNLTSGSQIPKDEGFTNARGDVKQASLNSALDERYKRSRKKGGIRSMLRLGKNRKSLNFGDNSDNRHESRIGSFVARSLTRQQKRFRSNINIQKPKVLHYQRALVTKFVTPYYPKARPPKPLWELCDKAVKNDKKKGEPREPHPYAKILAREYLERFESSKMIGFLHMNSISSHESFNLAVALHKHGMMLKVYGKSIASIAVKGTPYEAILSLYSSPLFTVFGKEPKVNELRKIVNKTPEVVLIAGILENRLLSLNDFLKYGKMNLVEAQAGLVHTLRTAGGANLNRQLTHHQSTLVSRLDQISKPEISESDTNVEEPKSEA